MRQRYAVVAALLSALTLTACAKGGAATPVSAPSTIAAPTANQPAADQTAGSIKQADALMVAGKYAEGIDLLLKVLGDESKNAAAWDLLAFGFNQLDRYAPAMVASQRALALNPSSAAVQFNAGVARAFSRNPDYIKAAAQPLEEAAAANPQPYTFSLLGRVHNAFGDRNGAVDAFKRGLAKFPDNADLKRALAVATADVNLDGTPDQVLVEKGTVIIRDGARGKELLRWTQPQPGNIFASVVDLGGPGPAVLIDTPPFSAEVHVWNSTGKALTGTVPGPVQYDPVARDLTYAIADKSVAASYIRHVTIKDGKLATVREEVIPFKEPEPLPTNLLELNTVLAGPNRAIAFVAHNAQSLSDKLQTLPAQAIKGVILLPEPDGNYRLEVHANGLPQAKATATIANDGKSMLISGLTWR